MSIGKLGNRIGRTQRCGMSTANPTFTSSFFLLNEFPVLFRNALLHIVLSFRGKETDSFPNTRSWLDYNSITFIPHIFPGIGLEVDMCPVLARDFNVR